MLNELAGFELHKRTRSVTGQVLSTYSESRLRLGCESSSRGLRFASAADTLGFSSRHAAGGYTLARREVDDLPAEVRVDGLNTTGHGRELKSFSPGKSSGASSVQ